MGTTNILDLNNRVSKLADSYPADKVMMSDGVTSVEDKIGKIFFVEKSISNVSINTTWGGLFNANVAVDISSLGLSKAPDVVSATFSATDVLIAFCTAASINENNISVTLTRAESGTVRGKIMIMLKSNG